MEQVPSSEAPSGMEELLARRQGRRQRRAEAAATEAATSAPAPSPNLQTTLPPEPRAAFDGTATLPGIMRSSLNGGNAWAAPVDASLASTATVSMMQRPDLAVTIQPSAATLFAQEAALQDAGNNTTGNNGGGFRANLARVLPPPAPPNQVYEENVTTGGFRKVQVGEAFDSSSTWRDGASDPNGAGSTTDEADEALPPSYSLSTGLDRYTNLIWRGCSMLLTGIVVALVVIVEKQSQPSSTNTGTGNTLIASAILSLSQFISPLRLLMYFLAMVGFLGAAEQYIQLRKASRLAVETAIAQRAASAAGDGIVNLGGQSSSSSASGALANVLPIPRQTISRGLYTKLAVFSQGLVAATVLASLVMDNRLRTVGSQPGQTVAGIAANSTAITDFNAWLVIVIIRLVACLLSMVFLLLTMSGPEEVDRIIADRIATEYSSSAGGGASSAVAPLLVGGAGGGGGAGNGIGGGNGSVSVVPIGGKK
jgi:hypothetical protein